MEGLNINKKETTQARSQEQIKPKHYTEDAIAKIQSMYEACRTNGTCDPDGIKEIIESSELSYMNERITKGEVPSFQQVLAISKKVSEELHSKFNTLDEEELHEIEKLTKRLEDRPNQINRAISGYSRSILRFHNLKRLKALQTDHNTLEAFEKADHDRRRNHEILIESLQVFQRTLGEFNIGDIVDEESIDDNDFFPKEMLLDRDQIRDWAVVTKLNNHLSFVEDEVAESNN